MSNTAASANGSRLALYAVLPAVPVLNLGYQFCAEKLAQATLGAPLGLSWFTAALSQPWTLALIALEAASFAGWMIVLARLSLSAAFPLTAVSYGLVTLLGWVVFHEPVRLLEIIGGIFIAGGVFLIGSEGRKQ